MAKVGGEKLNCEDVKTREGNRDCHFAQHEENCLQQVTVDKLGKDAENSTANHSEEKRFLASGLVHDVVGDKIAGNLDQTNNLVMISFLTNNSLNFVIELTIKLTYLLK